MTTPLRRRIGEIVIVVILAVALYFAYNFHDPTSINGWGSFLVGIVFGWMLVHTAAAKSWDWKAYLAILGAVVGGAGVDYLFKTIYVGYFWIGIFVGFVADQVIRFLTGKKIVLNE